ncbi:MAG: biotin/lipoyl-binding protein [Lachnospiraceae bacterium]|nr:biotin/lipoyl-binding protein [Lachnospiraceae bacterium]
MEKNKKWIKLFLAFLAVMWLCTIISKSIYVSGLTRVKTDSLSKKYIEHIVEADGIVLAGGEVSVNTLSGLRVEKICVQQGDEVKQGDALFTVDLRDLEDLIAQKENEIARIELQLSTAQFNETLDAQKKEVALLWAKEDYENADKETALAVERAQSALLKAENELQKHLDTDAPHTSSADRKKAWNKYNEWKKRCYELEDKIATLEKEIQKLKNEIEDAVSAVTADVQAEGAESLALERAETEDSEIENVKADRDVKSEAGTEDKKALLAQKEKELEELKAELTELERNPVSQPDYSAEENAYDAWQQTKSGLEDTVQAAKRALEDANLARESTLRQKRRDVASAEVLSNADATVGLYNMEIAALQGEIADLNDVKSEQCTITSKVDGYVAGILVATGQRTTDTAAMLLTDTTSECMFKFSITKEQGKYVRLGDGIELTLSSVGRGSINVTADYITENNAGGYDVTCRLGDAKAPIGAYGMVKRTVQGDLHPNAVPIDAIYNEHEVYYLFTLQEKTGILGKEYYVEKLKVNVTDKNDRYAAIEGAAIGSDAQIVIFSSKELKQGESVRPQE